MSKFNKLKDTLVLIVGGTSGIGFATAEASIEAGARVTIASSTQARLDSALERLKTAYPSSADKIQGHLVDISNASTLEPSLTTLLNFATKNNTAKLDHIVYTAANTPHFPTLQEYTASETKSDTLFIRFDAPIVLAKLAREYLNPGPRSSITITGASTASRPVPGRGLLSSLGSATEGITRGLAVDLAPIRVNAVAPGATNTELMKALAGPDPKVQEHFMGILKGLTLVDKVGDPEDVAEAYIYLMKDANATGTTIYSDGGRLLK
jgi:NAD(P)-dependent dehydrogenase (short-subunit alcohol dehydrogenase family)